MQSSPILWNLTIHKVFRSSANTLENENRDRVWIVVCIFDLYENLVLENLQRDLSVSTLHLSGAAIHTSFYGPLKYVPKLKETIH